MSEVPVPDVPLTNEVVRTARTPGAPVADGVTVGEPVVGSSVWP